jgi:AcrR family transcriptional regulator
MAIIVDKVQKRLDIALSCRELFVHSGINSLTIAQIAKEAGVGKGTIYEYFANKEEIVFELVNVLMQEHSTKLLAALTEKQSVKEKVKKFSNFFYEDEHLELRSLYKQFVAISLVSPDEAMVAFQTACFNNYYIWFEELLREGVKNGELIPESLGLIKGLFSTAEGMFITSCATTSMENLEKDLHTYLDNLFNLIEVKK